MEVARVKGSNLSGQEQEMIRYSKAAAEDVCVKDV